MLLSIDVIMYWARSVVGSAPASGVWLTDEEESRWSGVQIPSGPLNFLSESLNIRTCFPIIDRV